MGKLFKKEKIKPYFVSEAPIKTILVDDYEITFESCFSSYFYKLSKQNQTAYLELLHQAQLSPKGCIKKVLELKKTCTDSPELDNLLTYLYTLEKNVRKAEALIEESYKKYPGYFLAKINYADQLLRSRQTEKFKQVIPSEDLKKCYPKKGPYHVTEFRSFMILLSRYHLLLKQTEPSFHFYDLAKKADPAHPSIIALEKKLFKTQRISLFSKFLSYSKTFVKKLLNI